MPINPSRLLACVLCVCVCVCVCVLALETCAYESVLYPQAFSSSVITAMQKLTHTHRHTHTLTQHTNTLPYTHIHVNTHTHTLPPTNIHCTPLSLSVSLSNTHTHTHTHTPMITYSTRGAEDDFLGQTIKSAQHAEYAWGDTEGTVGLKMES